MKKHKKSLTEHQKKTRINTNRRTSHRFDKYSRKIKKIKRSSKRIKSNSEMTESTSRNIGSTLKRIDTVNNSLDGICGNPSLFYRKKVEEKYLFCEVEGKGYKLPVLYCDKINAIPKGNREGFMYPFTVFRNRCEYEISTRDIDIPKVLECINSDDFCNTPKNRALFFAGIVWRELSEFKNLKDAATFIQQNKHYQKLFEFGCNDTVFDNTPLRMIKTEAFFEKKAVMIDAFYLKNLLSRQYGRISSFDLFAHADPKLALIDQSLHWTGDYYQKFWEVMSRTFASRCSGEVLVLTGTEHGNDHYFEKDIELENLLKNEKVTSITEINIKYPELPARIIIPNNKESRMANIGIFSENTNSILKNILAADKDKIIVLDFGISEYRVKAYETLGNKIGKGTVFLNVGRHLKEAYKEIADLDDDSRYFNKAIERAVEEYSKSQFVSQEEQNNNDKINCNMDVEDFSSNQFVCNTKNKNINSELNTEFSTNQDNKSLLNSSSKKIPGLFSTNQDVKPSIFDFSKKQDSESLFTSIGEKIPGLFSSNQEPKPSVFDKIERIATTSNQIPKQESEDSDYQYGD